MPSFIEHLMYDRRCAKHTISYCQILTLILLKQALTSPPCNREQKHRKVKYLVFLQSLLSWCLVAEGWMVQVPLK